MKSILSLLFCTVGFLLSHAASYTFTSQAQIDSFPILHPNVIHISGTLTIQEAVPGNITNLHGLSNLIAVGKYVHIQYNSALTDLTGLNALTEVGWQFLIIGNASLVNLNGLNSLTEIGDHLHIYENASLVNLTGLNALESTEILLISDNPSLTSLNGLESLTHIRGQLAIAHDPLLTNLAGLESLVYTEGISIAYNASITSLEGLESLQYAEGVIILDDNPNLVDISALSGLDSIAEFIRLKNNAVLADLTGLENINPASMTGLQISGCPLLSYCHLSNFCTYLANHSAAIFDNAHGCESRAWVLAYCESLNCPPSDSVLSTQTMIDNFLTDYPACDEVLQIDIQESVSGNIVNLNGLQQLHAINGDLLIQKNTTLNNLTGLNGITSIARDLTIQNNANLTNLSGLNGINIIRGDLTLQNNASLSTLSGLNGLIKIEGSFNIKKNQSLTDMSAMNNIDSIGQNLAIENNDGLEVLSGWPVLSFVSGNLSIKNNPAMTGFTGLNDLAFIWGSLTIKNNPALTNFTGLQQLYQVGEGFYIENNAALTNLGNLYWLEMIAGGLYIKDNPALNDLAAFHEVNSIAGNFLIKNNDALTSLEGFDELVQLTGTLTIKNNNLLTSCEIEPICQFLTDSSHVVRISGNAPGCNSRDEIEAACNTGPCPLGDIVFDSQAAINAFPGDYPACTDLEGNLVIQGADIADLGGLAQINAIEGGLIISSNPLLPDLSGLEGLNSIGESLLIKNNTNLTNLSGLSGITSFAGPLSIKNNPVLSLCEIQGICYYLALPSNPASISGNATGCASRAEVEEACFPALRGAEQPDLENGIRIFPNPTTGKITVSGIPKNEPVKVRIIDGMGRLIKEGQLTASVFDLSDQSPGLYLITILTESQIITKRLIVK